MITVDEAIALVCQYVKPLKTCKIDIGNASGHVLGCDVYASIDIPAFRQSSMDGYAFRFEECSDALKITGEMAAGSSVPFEIAGSSCSRIFTGAPLPNGADTVVMQEKVLRNANVITIRDDQLTLGANVRAIGSEIKKDSLAMEKGTTLNPAAIGFLAGIGTREVEAIPQPKVTIIVTGKELREPGTALGFGQIYESNSYSLQAALKSQHVLNVKVKVADDDLNVLSQILNESLNCSDIVLLTGGVSVGDYDFVIEATKRCGVEQVFHKVRQKPGKPLYFGMYKEKPVFGLPGNPASVLSCYYNYVYPALNLLKGHTWRSAYISAAITQPYKKPAGLTYFLKGFYSEGKATPLQGQESYKLSSFALANCLIRLDEDKVEFKANDTIQILHLL
jgi:molybdopterin molybdotransferase